MVADLEWELRRLTAAWVRLVPEAAEVVTRRERAAARTERAEPVQREQPEEPELEPGHVQLQLSWEPGRVVAWGGGAGCRPRTPKRSWRCSPPRERRHRGGASTARCRCPPGVDADAFAIPVGDVLGWLVAAGAGEVGDDVAPSVRWLGRVAVWAVELTASGAMVPLLRRRDSRRHARGRGQRLVRGAMDAGARRPDAARALRRTHARFGARPRPQGRPARADPVRAHRHGRRDLSRQRASHRRARAAAAGTHGERCRRGVPRPSRRQCVRCAGSPRQRDRVARRAAGPAR